MSDIKKVWEQFKKGGAVGSSVGDTEDLISLYEDMRECEEVLRAFPECACAASWMLLNSESVRSILSYRELTETQKDRIRR